MEKENVVSNSNNDIAKKRSIKKRIISILAALSIITGGVITLSEFESKIDEVTRILNISGLTTESGIEKLINDNTIDGFWVALYRAIKLDGDINKIADKYVSNTGDPFENRMSGREVIVDINGESLLAQNFSSYGKIDTDAADVIDPISAKELLDYELTLDPVLRYEDGEAVAKFYPKLLPKQ